MDGPAQQQKPHAISTDDSASNSSSNTCTNNSRDGSQRSFHVNNAPKTPLMMKQKKRSRSNSPEALFGKRDSVGAQRDSEEGTRESAAAPSPAKKIKLEAFAAASHSPFASKPAAGEPSSTTTATTKAEKPTVVTLTTAATTTTKPSPAAAAAKTTVPTFRKGGGRIRLPDKLMEYLIKDVLPDTLWWQSDGDGFVFDINNIQTKFLDKYFRGTKLSSFIRSLNRWGFRRVFYHSLPENALAFHNELFKKDDPDRIRDMQMLSYTARPKNKSTTTATSPGLRSQSPQEESTGSVGGRSYNSNGSVIPPPVGAQQHQVSLQQLAQSLLAAQQQPAAAAPQLSPAQQLLAQQPQLLQQVLLANSQQHGQQQQQEGGWNIPDLLHQVLVAGAGAAATPSVSSLLAGAPGLGGGLGAAAFQPFVAAPQATTAPSLESLLAALTNSSSNASTTAGAAAAETTQAFLNRVRAAQQQPQTPSSDPVALLQLLQSNAALQQVQQQQVAHAAAPADNTALLLLLQQQQQQQYQQVPLEPAAVLQLLQRNTAPSQPAAAAAATTNPAALLQLLQSRLSQQQQPQVANQLSLLQLLQPGSATMAGAEEEKSRDSPVPRAAGPV